MPALVEIHCPHCKTSLKLKSRDPLGKKVKCPKCTQSFVATERRAPVAAEPVDDYEDYSPAPAPAPRPKKRPKPRDEFDEFDDFGAADDSGADDDFDAPPRRSRGKKGVKKKKRTSSGWVKWVLIGVGGAGGVALVGLLIWLLVGVFGSKKLELAYLPADANNISVTRYGNLMKSELVKDAIDGDTETAISKMKDDYGFGIADIDSFTTASSSDESIRVLRTSVDLDPDKIMKHAGDYEKTTYDGKDLYRFGRSAVYFADKRTAVSGPEESVKRAIDRGTNPKKREDLAFVDAGYDMLTVSLRKKTTSNNRVSMRGNLFGMSLEYLSKQVGTSNGTSVSSSTVTVENRIKFESAEDAAKYYDEVKTMQEKFKEMMNKNEFRKGLTDEQRKEVEEFANSVSWSFSRSGDVIKTTMKFTPSERMRKKSFLGMGNPAASKIKYAAQSPGNFFGFPMFQNPFGNQNRFGGNFRGNRFQPAARRNVKIYDVTVSNYRGNEDRAFAAKVALKGINGLDDTRTDVNGNRITVYSRPHQSIALGDITQKLQQKGFNGVNVVQFRSE